MVKQTSELIQHPMNDVNVRLIEIGSACVGTSKNYMELYINRFGQIPKILLDSHRIWNIKIASIQQGKKKIHK